jgi:hypothetical protein
MRRPSSAGDGPFVGANIRLGFITAGAALGLRLAGAALGFGFARAGFRFAGASLRFGFAWVGLGFAEARLRFSLTVAAFGFRPAFETATRFRFADFDGTPRPLDGLILFFIHPSPVKSSGFTVRGS